MAEINGKVMKGKLDLKFKNHAICKFFLTKCRFKHKDNNGTHRNHNEVALITKSAASSLQKGQYNAKNAGGKSPLHISEKNV